MILVPLQHLDPAPAPIDFVILNQPVFDVHHFNKIHLLAGGRVARILKDERVPIGEISGPIILAQLRFALGEHLKQLSEFLAAFANAAFGANRSYPQTLTQARERGESESSGGKLLMPKEPFAAFRFNTSRAWPALILFRIRPIPSKSQRAIGRVQVSQSAHESIAKSGSQWPQSYAELVDFFLPLIRVRSTRLECFFAPESGAHEAGHLVGVAIRMRGTGGFFDPGSERHVPVGADFRATECSRPAPSKPAHGRVADAAIARSVPLRR